MTFWNTGLDLMLAIWILGVSMSITRIRNKPVSKARKKLIDLIEKEEKDGKQ